MNTQTYQKPAGYTACFITYILYMVGPFTFGILWLAGLIVAIVSKSEAAPEIAKHLDYAKKVGIYGLINFIAAVIIAFILQVTLIGAVFAFLPYLIWWIWSLVISIRGLNALTSGTDVPRDVPGKYKKASAAYQKLAGYRACFITYNLYVVGMAGGFLTLFYFIPGFIPGLAMPWIQQWHLGIPWLAALIVAFVSKSGAAPEIAGHLDYAKKVGITGLISYIIVYVISSILMWPYVFEIFESSPPDETFIFVALWFLYLLWICWILRRGREALTSGAGAPRTYLKVPGTYQEPAGHAPRMDGEPEHHAGAPATNQEPDGHTPRMGGESEHRAPAPATYQKPAGYTACLITYILYMVGPFTFGILWLAGLIVAIVSKGGAAPAMGGHLGYAARVGIAGIIGFVIALVITFILVATIIGGVIAWLPGLIWWIWSLVKSIRGLNALTSGGSAPA